MAATMTVKVFLKMKREDLEAIAEPLFLIDFHDRPVAVVMPYEQFTAQMQTIEDGERILANSKEARDILAAIHDKRRGCRPPRAPRSE